MGSNSGGGAMVWMPLPHAWELESPFWPEQQGTVRQYEPYNIYSAAVSEAGETVSPK